MNLRKLDLNLLLVFEAIYSENSTTKAAEKLGITQPAVSNALNRLRSHFNDPLFNRSAKGMEPTPTAQRLAPTFLSSLKAVEASFTANENFDPRTSIREFKLMMPDALEPMILYPLLHRAAGEMPGLTFSIHPVAAPDYKEKIASKTVDIGIFNRSFNEDNIRSQYILSLPVSIIVRKNHPKYASREAFTLDDFYSAGFVALEDELRKSIQFNQEALATGNSRRIISKVQRVWSLLNTAAHTDLAAAVPTYMAQMYENKLGLKVFDLPVKSPADNCYMGWHEDFTSDPAHQWLRDTIMEVTAPHQVAPATPPVLSKAGAAL